MMTFSKLDLNAYDLAATKISYCKLFRHIMKDFVTRKDLQQVFTPSNIIVTTAVQVAVPAGTGTGTGFVTKAIYDGSVPGPASAALALQRERDKAAGGAAIDGSLGALSEVAG
jgi:hypothetical protein